MIHDFQMKLLSTEIEPTEDLKHHCNTIFLGSKFNYDKQVYMLELLWTFMTLF